MKLKSLWLGLVLMLGVLFCTAPAYAGEISLNVTNSIRDDGAHAFMPNWKPLAAPSYSVKIQAPEPQPAGWAGAFVYRFGGEKEDRASMGAIRTITPLTGRSSRFTFSLDGYAGATLRKAVPVAAVLFGARGKLFNEIDFGVHAGAITTQGLPVDFCFGLSATVRFNTPARPNPSTMIISQIDASPKF